MKLKFFTALISALTFCAPASALSCVRPDLAADMERAKASPDLYHIFVGTFKSEPLKKVDPRQPMMKSHGRVGGQISGKPSQFSNQPIQRKGQTIKTVFTGSSLSNIAQYDQQFQYYPMEIKITCTASWCGSPPRADQPVVAFVKARPGQSPLLTVSACPSNVHSLSPDNREVQLLRSIF